MKILIPTDFSQLSKIAIQYVIAFSKGFELDLTILHILQSTTPPMTRIGTKKLSQAIKTSSEQEMNELLKTLNKEHNHTLNVRTAITSGASIEKAVEAFALQNDIDMICIGTKGATGLKKIIFGSNAAGIIANSSIPVMTIPEFAAYKGIKNIIYSSDLEHVEKELKRLLPIASLFNAWIYILHITSEATHVDYKLQGQENRLKTLVSYDKLKVKALVHDSVLEGIHQYVAEIDADMVAMFTRHTALFERLFSKSVTKTVAFQTKTPLLTFQKK